MPFTPSRISKWITVNLGAHVDFAVHAPPATGEERRALELAYDHALEDVASAAGAMMGTTWRDFIADRVTDWRDVLDANGEPIPWPETVEERRALLDATLSPHDMRTTAAAIVYGAGEAVHVGK